jgi:hypothetical protein
MISLSQICGGQKRKDGTALDTGTGLSRRGAIYALNGLIAKGIVGKTQESDERGQRPNTYYIVLAGGDESQSTENTTPCIECTPPCKDGPLPGASPASPPMQEMHPQNKDVQKKQTKEETTRDARDVWAQALRELHGTTTAENYRQWYAPTRQLSFNGHVVTVAVPTDMHRRWLDTKLRRQIVAALARTGYGQPDVTFQVLP